ncbi:altronate dehydratase family protein [Flavobacterium sp. Fl-77]|uniref:Altronate dehydratase family protein n=1 Tax=Flavobacterium flavipigmentatum TaxID=2893884 RepID=A0AAJ2SBM0_9FLAO|nr:MULTISPECIES: altronate dehydratase family protein [unclassified Flavobacterium]MDX6183620.1 altronate dehydratase family protein [Flavobacterium sp. Fl-33]MDX6187172.1 altronate dehydratase family protein [Flavobacterium sp. Fl-77]UFH38017.1 altronate dehydratase family protein [Flavobacterium sp. F-70]
MATQKKLIKVHPTDNVAVALVNLIAGEVIDFEGESVTIESDVKMKHKIAMIPFNAGDRIIMYGVLVGKASARIEKGGLLSTSNVKHESDKVTGKTETIGWTAPNVDKWKDRTFLGYHREDGQVGTENIWLFFPLVFCENRNIEILKDIFEKELMKPKENDYQLLLRSLVKTETGGAANEAASNDANLFNNIEVKFITHQGGCGGIRQDSHSLAKLLAGYVNNPNVAGATVLSLGCQNLQIQIFKDALDEINPNSKKPVLIYDQQQIGTIEAMLSSVVKDTFEAIKKANEIKRTPAPLSKLKIGLECGGSDGFSGISANPTLGVTSDMLTALGGTTILSEFPELCGVEQELVNRCNDDTDGKRFLELMKWYEKTVVDAGSGFDMNPSPGNIKDGLITDAMKSAGAAKKGGTSPIVGVSDYGEYISKPGLNLLCTPGNDVECTTAMVGSGANMVLFTTGLGTPTGNPIAPVVKVSSNSELARKMSDIIDIDTGGIITGEKSIEEMADEMLEFIIDVASGTIKTKAAILNQNDFIPWKRGVSL